MRLFIVAILLFATSYAQTVYNYPMPYQRLRRPRQATSGADTVTVPWDTIKQFVDEMANQQEQNTQPQTQNSGTYGDQYTYQPPQHQVPTFNTGDQYYQPNSVPGPSDPSYQYMYPQNMWYHPPNGGSNFQPSNGKFEFHGGQSSSSGSSHHSRTPPKEVLSAPCGLNVSPIACTSDENCMWSSNAAYDACVGEMTPCEFLVDQGTCTAVGEGEACMWDPQGGCYGEMTPCGRLFSETSCTTSAQECEWSLEANACWSESMMCADVTKELICGLLEDCHWEIQTKKCAMGEAPEMFRLRQVHQTSVVNPSLGASPTSVPYGMVSLAFLGGFLAVPLGVLIANRLQKGFPKRNTELDHGYTSTI